MKLNSDQEKKIPSLRLSVIRITTSIAITIGNHFHFRIRLIYVTFFQEAKIWIAGTIVSVNSGKNDWCYKACDVCPKKVDPKEGGMWECKKCEKTTNSYTIRYKVEIIAFDEITTITFLLWDIEILGLLGVKAQKVASDDGYPSILDELLEKRLLFRVNVKAENISGKDMVFTVWDICSDEDVVERYYLKLHEADNNTQTGITEAGSNNELVIYLAIVNLQNDSDSQLNMMQLN
ncbi:hypothetical protein PIB30_090532 [Stylosanthes scabra]|uniref:Replication factor A C-terminal domain-containing protein n=1 Tax=Stylosanthes scabra TaxID=79078 RepID=A0ABU6WSN6_9FABA|nr:hypothetical protein [Stylosanthes scabra]